MVYNTNAHQMTKISLKGQGGFSLLEVFIALAIGLVIFAGELLAEDLRMALT